MPSDWYTKEKTKKPAGGAAKASGWYTQQKGAAGPSTSTDPRDSLDKSLNRLNMAAATGQLSEGQAKTVAKAVKKNSAGVPTHGFRLGNGVEIGKPDPDATPSGGGRSALQTVWHGGSSVLGSVLRNVGRPGQAVVSALAEGSRQGEAHPVKLGPITMSPFLPAPVKGAPSVGSIVQAARSGFALRRHDTPLSISKEAGDIRASQGRSTKAFGVVPGSDLRTNPLGAPKPLQGVSNLAFDVGGQAALDPLSYVTFGTGGAAKSALKAAEETLGAERAAVLAKGGLKALEEGERANLAATLAPDAQRALAGVRGGLNVKTPTLARLGEGKLLTEPKTLIPGSTFSAAASPLKPLGRAIADSKVAQAAGAVFRPRDAIRRQFGEKAAQQLDDARVHYKGTFQSSVEDDVATITAAAKAAKVTNDELETIVGPALDIGHEGVAVPERLAPVVDAFKQVRERFTSAQVDAGIVPEEAMHLTDEYLPRVLTDEGRKLFTEETAPIHAATAGTPSMRGLRDPFTKGRTLMPESSVADINTEFAAKAGGPVFHENPAVAFAHRSTTANKAVATKGFVDDVMKITDRGGAPLFRPLEDFTAVDGGSYVRKAATKLPEGYVEVNVPKVGRFAAPKELAAEVDKIAGLSVNDAGLKALKSGLDKWQNLWKGYATVPFIFGAGFHERNAIGNVFNNWLRGISPADPAYLRGVTLQRRLSKGLKAGDAYKFLGAEDRKLIGAARKYDVIGEGFYGGDLAKDTAAKIGAGKRTPGELAKAGAKRLNPLSTDNAVIASGRKLGSAVEENARLAHFIYVAKETGSYTEAARSVRKYLFDYSDLTTTEKEIFKRVHGFYTFTRKNLPLQVAELLRQPGKFAKVQQGRVALADQAPDPEGLYPGYLDEIGGTPLPSGVSKVLGKIPGGGFDPSSQLVFAPDLPVTNASDAITPAVHLAAQLPGLGRILPKGDEGVTGPLRDLLSNNLVGGAPGAVSTAAQVAAGREFFSGRELKDGRRSVAPVYASGLPFTQRRMVDGKMQPTLTDKSRFVAESLLPTLSKLAGSFPRGKNDQDKAPRRRLSALTGLRVYPLGEGTQRSEAYRRLDAIQKLIADLEAQGVDVPKNKAKKKP